MEQNTVEKPSVTMLGLGAMGTALARTWLAAGHPLTVWNRTPARAAALAPEGARVAGSAAQAVAANTLVVVCLLDDTRSTRCWLASTWRPGPGQPDHQHPAQARARAAWAHDTARATWTAESWLSLR